MKITVGLASTLQIGPDTYYSRCDFPNPLIAVRHEPGRSRYWKLRSPGGCFGSFHVEQLGNGQWRFNGAYPIRPEWLEDAPDFDSPEEAVLWMQMTMEVLPD